VRAIARAWPGAILVAAGLLACPGAESALAASRTETASVGAVSATLTYEQLTNHGAVSGYRGLRVTIQRAGITVYERAVSSRFCRTMCEPEGGGRVPSVHVANLEGGGEPGVLVDLYTGGAHCCSVSQVLRFDAGSGAYRLTEHNWGDPGAQLLDLNHDGKLEFLTADDRFAYVFTAFAFSGLPLQIYKFTANGFVDVTASFPRRVAADATQWLKQYSQNRRQGFGLGFLAAWAADEDRLGHRRLVASTLARENGLGHLLSSDGPSASGHHFISKLQSFLRHTGYA
jgi:hypothetical protein